jgi:DNA-binding MarR family transcriptional regulator
MINQARCQRRIYKKTFGRTISEKAYLSTKFINPQKNKLFEYYINRYGVTRAFSIGYDWLAMICGVGRTTVKKWINDFVKAGFIKKEVRYSSLMKKNYTNTYRITLYLKMIMTALLPLMPSLYSFGNNGHSKYISSCLSELKTALLFNDLSVHAYKYKSLYLS